MKHPKNRIIVFANQKGGVGKSTLCILLANYLHYWKRKVCVIDTDLQQSASMQREIDKQALGGVPPYSIQSFVISDPDTMEMVMASAEEFDGYVLIDAPGNIQDDGLAVVLARADYIVCPYEYETKSLISTQTFVGVVEQLRQLNPSMTTKLFLVPNRVDVRVGTKDEWNMWEEKESELAQYGIVTPRVGYRMQMRRVNTYVVDVEQKHAVHEPLKYIIRKVEGK